MQHSFDTISEHFQVISRTKSENSWTKHRNFVTEYQCKIWLKIGNRMTIDQKRIWYEGGISYNKSLLLALYNIKKNVKGNFSNKSISFIITLACWNTGLLHLTFLTLTARNRGVTIQINYKINSDKFCWIAYE